MDIRFDQLKEAIIAGDADFRCFNCDYNLRGLEGDPKRCPECGWDNPIGELAISEEDIERALRKSETLPTLFLATTLLFLGLTALSGILISEDGWPSLYSSTGVLVVFFAGITFALFVTFQKRSQMIENGTRKSAYILCLGIFICIATFLLVGFPFLLFELPLAESWEDGERTAFLIGDALCGFLLLLKLIAWYRRKLDELQHEHAIQLIHEQWQSGLTRRSNT